MAGTYFCWWITSELCGSYFWWVGNGELSSQANQQNPPAATLLQPLSPAWPPSPQQTDALLRTPNASCHLAEQSPVRKQSLVQPLGCPPMERRPSRAAAPRLGIQHHLFPSSLPRAPKMLDARPSPEALPAGLQGPCQSSRAWFAVLALGFHGD